jgi:hypothetical protein
MSARSTADAKAHHYMKERSMRAKGIAMVAAISVVIAGGTTAASLASDPGSLVIRKGDFPANAKYNWGRLPANVTQGLAGLGVKGSGAYVSVTIPKGNATKYESINGFVVTTGNSAQGKTAYAAFKEDIGTASKTVLRLPAYGDEQLALYQSRPSGKAELIVRRSSVVWQVEVAGGGLLALSRAALLAELQKYAAAQKRRVGTG